MKKHLSILLVLLILLTGCGSKNQKTDNGNNEVLKAATEACIYPWTFTEDGEIKGFEADMMKEITKRTNYDIQMSAVEWSGIFGALDSGRVSTIASLITINDERKEKYDFTKPYVYNPMVLATKKDSDIKTMDDIDGKTIVVEVGSSDEMVLKELESKFNVTLKPVYYEGISITDVENGRVDLWIGGEPSVNASIEKGYDLRIVGATGSYQEYGYPFLRDEENSKKREAFDKAIEEMRKDGTLSEISKKWFNIDITCKSEE